MLLYQTISSSWLSSQWLLNMVFRSCCGIINRLTFRAGLATAFIHSNERLSFFCRWQMELLVCGSEARLLSPNSPPASTSVPIKPLIHLQVMTHQLLPELSATVISPLRWQLCSCGKRLSVWSVSPGTRVSVLCWFVWCLEC